MDKVIKVINLLKIAIILALGLFSPAGYSLSSDWAISEKSKVRLISPMTASNNNKLTYKLEHEFSIIPSEIEKLETIISQMNNILSDADLYTKNIDKFLE